MEAYSPTMLTAVQHQVQHASLARLRELLAYFRQRHGPGLALVETEIRQRWARRCQLFPSTNSK